ncbi:glycogen synthase [Capnocytophaga catalasegens]|uniref:starch synthase n=2 Tax=Capnocytophaga catalasegens TaxID=1004260 RepID=A0AAV5AXY9_9FLAO|nr:glycogen synthase [Capnocytophaga catalasegens]GJM50690.1 glycogen synthase [Capnocytophaga catalasegens]GJM51843.1 glycogen synthase [Capnocytophaga catalasegens]
MPYVPETTVSKMALEVAKALNTTGAEIRLFMPRYGNINERRHQLHEVIRLSGLNLVVNDIDMPLVIKVASIPKERIQVYFIDNDEYFQRKTVSSDENGKLFPDNDERCIFFAKGIVETIKKLNWTPDIIHIQGWLGALLPLYLRTYYKDEPIFSTCKIITSVFNEEFAGMFDKTMIKKVEFDQIDSQEIIGLAKPNYENLMRIAVQHSDAIIVVGDMLSKKITDFIKKGKKPVLYNSDTETFQEAYFNFYNKIY